jgi:hypothetical protein
MTFPLKAKDFYENAKQKVLPENFKKRVIDGVNRLIHLHDEHFGKYSMS